MTSVDLALASAQALADKTGEPHSIYLINGRVMIIPESEENFTLLEKIWPTPCLHERLEGERARRGGMFKDSCPYSFDQPRKRQAWLDGWEKEHAKGGYI